ncbi:MAG TPA: zinc-ribbon domain-containing protein [Anaeromyxobacteraceae bacterium]|nr:zinc-ribbon domain-containing protein [Anaeromyxobacteraceae bacterium]
MIVTCTSCQSRFRIRDGRIGPKGAKVRCSKCKAVFVVKPGDAAEAAAAEPRDSFALAPPAPDPFAAAAAGPAQADDPFAARPPGDLFAASISPASTPEGPPSFDAFAAAPSDSSPGASHLPVTDLSHLAGGIEAAPPPASFTPLAPPLPPPLAAAPPEAAAESGVPVTRADDLVLEESSRPFHVAPPPLPSAPAFDFGRGADLTEPAPADAPGADLSFEFGAPGMELSEPPAAEPVPGLEIGAGSGSFLGGADFAGAGPFPSSGSGDPFGAGGPLPELGGARPPPIAEPIAPEPQRPALARPVVAARRKAGAATGGGPLSAPATRRRLQGFLVNAVSLAALLAVAAGLLSWWLGGSGRERASGGPVTPAGVSSGVYEAAGGSPVLFVRGEVRSRGTAPLGRVLVRAEVLVGGEVRASAEGLAGAIPTAEEVAQIETPQDAAQLRARVAARAPPRLEPGGSLPFLVIFDAVPDGFRDAVFRVAAEPLPKTARAP